VIGSYVVIGHDDGVATLFQSLQNGAKAFLSLRVQLRRGLVQEEYGGLHGEDRRQSEPVFFTGGEFLHVPRLVSGKADCLKGGPDSPSPLFGWHAEVHRTKGHFITHRCGEYLRLRVLENDPCGRLPTACA